MAAGSRARHGEGRTRGDHDEKLSASPKDVALRSACCHLLVGSLRIFHGTDKSRIFSLFQTNAMLVFMKGLLPLLESKVQGDTSG